MTLNVLSFSGARMWSAAALSTAALGAAVVVAQAPPSDPHHDAVVEQTRPVAGMMGGQHMMVDQKAMMARMAVAEQKLEELVAQMNAAKGEQKIAAIAAAVTELATQQRETDAQLLRLQNSTMDQMMSRMSAMHGSGGMMKRTPEPAKDAADTEHTAHHPEK